MKLLLPTVVTMALSLFSCAWAIDESELPEKLHTVYGLYLTPLEAYNMKSKGGDEVLLVDVRARPELKYVGASDLIDANIPSRFMRTDFAWSDKAETYAQPATSILSRISKNCCASRILIKTRPSS